MKKHETGKMKKMSKYNDRKKMENESSKSEK